MPRFAAGSDAEGPQRVGGDVLADDDDIRHEQRHRPGDSVLHGRPAAPVGHMHQPDAGLLGQQRRRDMGEPSRTGGRVGEMVGLPAGGLDQVGEAAEGVECWVTRASGPCATSVTGAKSARVR